VHSQVTDILNTQQCATIVLGLLFTQEGL